MNGQSGRDRIRLGEDEATNEGSPLLHTNPQKGNRRDKLQQHMNAHVSRAWADMALLGCYVITGLLDSSAISIWGAFVSMQTGNTVYLGLGVVRPSESDRWIKSVISIASFCLGSTFFSNFHRYFTPRKRWVLVVSFTIQLLIIIMAALIVEFGGSTDNGLQWQVVLPLMSVAFQSSGQAVASRVLEQGSFTSVVLTSTYCDLFSDQNLLSGIGQNPTRNRRVAAPALLLLGAVFGGLWSESRYGMAAALWTAVILKFLVISAWVVWPAESNLDDDSL
ncbi:hypothetical protein M501DRAFT_1011763 [Patellaria atrata CBS 101060]|uniref:DUF1275 domain protein n=1 Tax=Patellaria atrata CBS 101060 TaxID=1346257 RepID=A0A9P4S8P0_9PEZI|nr:hypothetical protein M501DRAFT_1011763 [Patellaria atrata CBS 101060]